MDQTLPGLQQPSIDNLARKGLNSFQLFCAVGGDASSNDCALKVSNLFKTQDQAQTAAGAMQRPEMNVVSWRTDECGSFTVVA